MTELFSTLAMVLFVAFVHWLMRRQVRAVTHPPKRHQDRDAAVVHEVDKGIYGV